jgi:hypothetical protein
MSDSDNFFSDYDFESLEYTIVGQDSNFNSQKFLPNFKEEQILMQMDFWFSDTDTDSITQQNISIPDVKLYYPEPFIASPSFVHEEI